LTKYKSSDILVRKNVTLLSSVITIYLLEQGLSTGDFERWMKRALECSSLKRLNAEGPMGRAPGRYVKKGSGYGLLSP
jgi:hypothetical protein